jgi:two-component system aerobic respiration control sensor histidine kinase ArcB
MPNAGNLSVLSGTKQKEQRVLRILFVDDDETIRDAMVAILAWFGHEMRSASRGEDALAIYNSEQIDLVITDYQIPDMKGPELAEQIKAKNNSAKVILLTGWNGGDSALTSPHIDKTLAKPATIQMVIDTIKSLFGDLNY